jgi:TonB family protein
MTLLIESAVKAAAILAVAWIAALASSRAAADLRRRIWLAALMAVAILPGLLMLAGSALPPAMLVSIPTRAVASLKLAPAGALPGLFAVWVAGMLILLLRLVAGLAGVHRLGSRAVTGDVGVRYSDRATTPMTWGIFRPVILLPAYVMEWPEEQRRMVVRHEQAHIAAHDWWWQIFARLLTSVLWFHPLVWLAAAQLRREAERAADDHVLAGGASAPAYANQLLDVARRLSGVAPLAAVAMMRRPGLEGRVREILEPSRRRSPAGRLSRALIFVVAGALLLPLAAMQNPTVHKIGEDGLTPPQVVSKVEPHYTQEAKDAKIEGTVSIQLEIDEHGVADNIHVVKPLDSGLDENAVQAISQWSFEPGRLNGNPVRVAATIEVNFHL